MKKYILWFDFPNGKTYFKGLYIEDSNEPEMLEIPEFTMDILASMTFDSKEIALKYGNFFAGKYKYGIEEV